MMNSPRDRHIAFSISAGCYFYQLGIAYYIQKHFDLSGIKFSGASGGGWPALLLAAGIDVKEGFECVVKYAPECCQNRPILGAYMVYDQGISIVFEKLFRDVALPKVVNGRLALSVTRLAWNGLLPYLKDEHVTHFDSNDDIRQCIIASALIPYALNGKPYVVYRGWICADGGITNVTGVRHFAEELVHDIEMIEEQVAEQAHQLSDHLLTPHPHDGAPMAMGPYGIVRFGATITNALVTILSESVQRLMEQRRASRSPPPHAAASAPPVDVNTPHWVQFCKCLSRAQRVGEGEYSSLEKSSGRTGSYGASGGLLRGLSSVLGLHLPFSDSSTPLEALCSSQSSWPDSLCESIADNDVEESLWPGGSRVPRVDSREEDECVEFGLDSPVGPLASTTAEDGDDDLDGSICVESLSSMTGSSAVSTGSESGSEQHQANTGYSSAQYAYVGAPVQSPSPVIRKDNLIDDERTYWRVKGQLITKIPTGGVQLEISPWMWRHHSIMNYHLSADPAHARKLFEMGMIDAYEHHWDLLQFFDLEEYTAMLR